MADEITQVIELETKIGTILINGTLKIAQMIGRMINALFDWSEKKAGNKSIGNIIKLSEGPPVVLHVRNINQAKILEAAKKQGLHFAELPDYDPSDGLYPIFVPAQEAPMWNEIIKLYATQQLEKDVEQKKVYETEIAEETEKMQNAKTPEGKANFETRIENYKQAQDEIQRWIDYENGVLDKDDASLAQNDIVSYLKEFKGTDFEKHPERAMAEYEKGVEIGRKFTIKDCLQPVRDKSYIPDSSVMFYIPDVGASVTRTYHIDKETGLVYSNYKFKTKDGEIHTYSDHNMTAAKWNASELPELMDKANLLENTECRLFDTKEKLEAYLRYHNNVKSQAEINVEQRIANKEPVFSSAEAQKEVEHAYSEHKKGVASASIVDDKIKIVAEPDRLSKSYGRIVYTLDNGEVLMFNGLMNERVEKGKMVFEIEKNATVLHVKGESMEPVKLQGLDCLEIIEASKADQNLVSQLLNTARKGR